MTEKFEKKFIKIIPIQIQEQTKDKIRKLSQNPFIGKPLGNPYFRELKIDKFRIYFIIYEKQIIVILASVSNKKEQQKTINEIKENRKLLQEFIKNLKEY